VIVHFVDIKIGVIVDNHCLNYFYNHL